ncbi:MAG TPA: VWA domain-containing protein [Vicinamibacterales bacterium]|nr:VWA domain-containing protein [Vicinamibacterales bacterium]
MVRLVLLLVVSIGLLAAPAAQQTQPPAQPTFRTGAELVRVDVTVLDRRGHAVTSLTADDFVVFEDGVRQTIQSFRFVDVAAGPVEPLFDADSTVKTVSELARDDVRMFLVFWDEYHIPPHAQARGLRDDLTEFIRTMVAPADVVAIMDPWTPMSHLQFTRDRSALVAQIMTLQGRQGVLVPPRNAAEENHLRAGSRARFAREQVALSALRSAMLHLATLREGRKAVLYVGREFHVGPDTTSEALDLIQTANDANVAFYSINPDGLQMYGSRAGILSDIARNTGGESLLTNDIGQALQRAVAQASSYYLLGYAPQPLRRDGKFHKIDVKVTKGGLQVRARNGYWAPSVAELTASRRAAAEAALAPPVEAALSQLARLEAAGRDSDVIARTVFDPDPAPPALRLAAPRVWRVRTPAELRAVLSAAPPEPTTDRQFTRGDRLIVRAAAEGPAAGAAVLSVALVDRRGRRLTELPVSQHAGEWMIDVQLQSLARGGYLVLFELTSGDTRAAAYLPVRIE